MSIAPISPSPFTSASGSVPSWRSDFRQLSSALQNGDLSAAQSAYSSLTKDGASAANSPASQNSPLYQDFTAIGKALQNGDLGGAQDAIQKLRQDVQAQQPQTGVQGHHRHHHHHADNDADDQVGATGTTASTSTPTPDNTTGSIVNLTA